MTLGLPWAGLDAEFQDGYDTGHFPERAARGRFLIAVSGWPLHLAIDDRAAGVPPGARS